VGKKQGKTFGQVLKSTWRLAKLDVAMQEGEARRKVEAAKRAEAFKNWEPAKPSASYNDLSIPQSAFYNPNSKGRFGSHYAGD
jgi:hypothetical protein